MARPGTLTRLAAAALLLCASRPVTAQSGPLQTEARIDFIGPSPYRWQPGLGLTAFAGVYARFTAAIGYVPQSDSRFVANHWRGDVIARVLLDPFRQERWGLSVGGGLSVRRRTYIAAVIDLEGPPVGGWLPVVQAGMSGGARCGFALRRAISGRR